MEQEVIAKKESVSNTNKKQIDPAQAFELQLKKIINFKNPYDRLQLPTTATTDEIQKCYRKMSLQLHPDKCKHKLGPDAFSKLKEAVTILQDEDRKKFYVEVRRRATEETEKSFRKRRGGNFADDEEFNLKVAIAGTKLVMDAEKQLKSSENNIKKNEDYERKKEEELKRQEEKRREQEKKWEAGQEERGQHWHQFLKKKKTEKAAVRKPTPKLPSQSKQ